MANFSVSSNFGRGFNIRSDFAIAEIANPTPWNNASLPTTYFGRARSGADTVTYEYKGQNLTNDSAFNLNSGTINAIIQYSTPNLLSFQNWALEQTSFTVSQLRAWGSSGNVNAMLDTVLAGADLLRGNAFSDTLAGFAGNDVIFGGSGNDILFGDGGNDTLRGETGNDTILGGHGHDTIIESSGTNSVSGDGGIDTLVHSSPRRSMSVSLIAESQTMVDGEQITSYRGRVETNGGFTVTNFANIENLGFVDGRLVLAVNDVAMQAARMYHTATGASPNIYGMNWWIDQLNAGVNLRTMATSFATNEFVAKYGTLNSTQFIVQVYQNSAGRVPNDAELAFWGDQLSAGMPRGDVMLAFSEYVETKNRVSSIYANGLWDQDGDAASIARLYQATLDRRPDHNGLIGWRAEMTAGKSLMDIVPGFLNSTEFTTLYGATNNMQFVTLLYNNVLDRAPDTAGLDGWVAQLNSGALSRAQVVLGFSESLEFRLNTMSWIEGGVVFA